MVSDVENILDSKTLKYVVVCVALFRLAQNRLTFADVIVSINSLNRDGSLRRIKYLQ